MSTAELFYELGGIFAKNVEKVERTLDKKLPFSEKVAFIKKNGPALKVTKKDGKVWKYQNLSVIQNLCEIKYGESRSSKIAVLAILGLWNFVNLVTFSLQKVQNNTNIKLQNL